MPGSTRPERLTEAEFATRQELLDTFYHAHGPCCAGCDWWHSHNSRAGECHRTAMIAGSDRAAPIGIEKSSLALGAGHVLTSRDHVCGEFKDEFDWDTLPVPYRKRIGRLSSFAGRRALQEDSDAE